MKRKHVAPIGADGHWKPSRSEFSQRTRVSSQTKDVPLQTVFSRLLYDVTNKNYRSRAHPRVTVSKPKNKRGFSLF